MSGLGSSTNTRHSSTPATLDFEAWDVTGTHSVDAESTSKFWQRTGSGYISRIWSGLARWLVVFQRDRIAAGSRNDPLAHPAFRQSSVRPKKPVYKLSDIQ